MSSTAATLNITIDRSADWSKVITITDSGGDPVVLTPAVAGVKQVETATTTGTVSGNGVLAVSFTSALTGTVAKLVTVVAGDTPTVTNAKICQAFNSDPRFSGHFRASYSTGSLIATALASTANDSTVNWSIGGTGTTATGVSVAATSANTTAGVAQVFGAASFKGQLSVRRGAPPIAEFRFEIIAGGDENQVRVVLPRYQTASLSPDQKYHFDWFADIGDSRARHVQGTATVRGNSTVFGTALLPSQSSTPVTPPSSSVAWGGITGTLSDQTDLQSELAGKLSATGTAADVDPSGTSIAAALAGKAPTSHTHVSADITDATNNAVSNPENVLKTDANGDVSVYNLTLGDLGEGLEGTLRFYSSGYYGTLSGGSYAADVAHILPSTSGTLLSTGDASATFSSGKVILWGDSAAATLTNLGAGTTGAELFQAATAAAARLALGVQTKTGTSTGLAAVGVTDITGLTDYDLEADTWYKLDLQYLWTSTSSNFQINFVTTGTFARGGTTPSLGQANISVAALSTVIFVNDTTFSLRGSVGENRTNVPAFGYAYFKTDTAGTGKVQLQLLAGTTLSTITSSCAVLTKQN